MHQRFELEKPRTLVEMQAVIDKFANDHDEYPTPEVRLRNGVAKIVVEEYLPLFRLAQILPGFKSANLTANSHSGPDAILLFDDGSQATVQITCAGENASEALKRELLNDRKIVFANQSAQRNERTHEIIMSGRALTTRDANTRATISDVISAIGRKSRRYRANTQFLLISIRRSEITMVKDWKQRLAAAVSINTTSPYERIYIATASTCFSLEQSA